jgi:hypothetical protein
LALAPSKRTVWSSYRSPSPMQRKDRGQGSTMGATPAPNAQAPWQHSRSLPRPDRFPTCLKPELVRHRSPTGHIQRPRRVSWTNQLGPAISPTPSPRLPETGKRTKELAIRHNRLGENPAKYPQGTWTDPQSRSHSGRGPAWGTDQHETSVGRTREG